MKLLLHTCCVPCAVYPLEQAKADQFKRVDLYFYNPNIHPTKEYLNRKKELGKLKHFGKFGILKTDYNQNEYFKSIKDFENKNLRCIGCWNLRLGKTAERAALRKYDAFSTTLLSSIYQDHEALKKICGEFAEKYKIKFYYKDFRTGFKAGHNKAREKKIYCQNYCGCIFSAVERYESKR